MKGGRDRERSGRRRRNRERENRGEKVKKQTVGLAAVIRAG